MQYYYSKDPLIRREGPSHRMLPEILVRAVSDRDCDTPCVTLQSSLDGRMQSEKFYIKVKPELFYKFYLIFLNVLF